MTSFSKRSSEKEEQWIYISDMMAGLMMIFLFISIMYIKNISDRYGAYEQKKEEICEELQREFKRNVKQWNMSICQNGVLIKFDSDLNFVLPRDILQRFESYCSGDYVTCKGYKKQETNTIF